METAIGVFSSRQRAEDAVKELLEANVPQASVVFLTRSETEAKTIWKELGATVGGFMGSGAGMSAGVAAALLVPGLGSVYALGFGAAALLGLAGAGTGLAVAGSAVDTSKDPQPTSESECAEDVEFFRDILAQKKSLIVVRTESADLANTASGILDRLGIGIQGKTAVKMQITTRQVAGVSIVDVTGRITVGEGNVMLREKVKELLENGQKKILVNLHEVGYVDSSGLGGLVRTYSSVRNEGGQMKIVNPSKRVHDLLQMTHLTSVFDVQADEASALQSFSQSAAAA